MNALSLFCSSLRPTDRAKPGNAVEAERSDRPVIKVFEMTCFFLVGSPSCGKFSAGEYMD